MDCIIEGVYIQLNQLMKKMDWVMSGGEAKFAIENGLVKVNGETAHEIRKKIRPGDRVSFEGNLVFVKA